MSTYVLDAISKPYPLISNRIRAQVYSESDLTGAVASIIDSTAGHPTRVWHFPGLPRDNYRFTLDEINGSDVVVTNLSLFDVVPGIIEGQLDRADEQIKCGTTPGFGAVTDIFFDGRETSVGSGIFLPDYVTWDIVPSELTGRGILAEGLDYSWDKDTGHFIWLQNGDGFTVDTYYNIHFNPQGDLPSAGGSVSTVNDVLYKLITNDYNILVNDFGSGILVESAADLLNLTFPDISLVKEGRLLRIETGNVGTMYTVKFISASLFKFGKGNIYMNPRESLIIRKYIHPSDGAQWRVSNEYGSFLTCGRQVSHDGMEYDLYNLAYLNGQTLSTQKYARLYNEYVLNLPIGWVVNYDDWLLSGNSTKYSFESAGLFHIPDRRGIFERNTNNQSSGVFQMHMIETHGHKVGYRDGVDGGVGGYGRSLGNSTIGWGLISSASGVERAFTDNPARKVNSNTISYLRGDASEISGDETRPSCYLINKYVEL